MKLNYVFKQNHLFLQALTHGSYSNENYQRLEFLGDAILDAAVAHMLFSTHPGMKEGDMTKARATLVNEKHLAEIAIKLEMYRDIRVDKGAEEEKVYLMDSVLADVFESLIGAIYMDGGYDAAFKFISEVFQPLVDNPPPDIDFKSQLCDVIQKRTKASPTYKVVQDGNDLRKITFKAEVYSGFHLLGVGNGPSKKAAEKAAAQDALVSLAMI